jgi:hypothetical protein
VVPADADGIGSETDPKFIAGKLLIQRRDFQIRLADSPGRWKKSSVLVARMFGEHGYTRDWINDFADDHSQITFQACRGESVFGTLTLCVDAEAFLPADAIYGSEIDAYRDAGASVCQLTRLAVDPNRGSRAVLGALVHAAYAFGRLRRITDAFIEVHPRHANFYQRILNFRLAGEPRHCPRVDAPATLLHLEVDYVTQQVVRYGGRHRAARGSLYPYFLSRSEDEALAQVLSVVALPVVRSQHFS